MFKVPIDKIIPVTSARARIASLVNEVQRDNSLYVLTRSGKPVAILASIEHVNNESQNLEEKNKSLTTQITTKDETKSVPEKIIDKNSDLVALGDDDLAANVPAKSQNDDQSIEIPIN